MSDYKKEYGKVTIDGLIINIMQNPYPTYGGRYRSVGMTDRQIEAAGGLAEISLPSDEYYDIFWDDDSDWENPVAVNLN